VPRGCSVATVRACFAATAYLNVYDLLEASIGGDGALQTGFRTRDDAVVGACVCVACTMALFTYICLDEVYRHMKSTFRLAATGLPPQLKLAHSMQHHLFLSHVWGSAQDQAALIKRTLQLLLPGVKVFLDIDNLEEIGDLERYVKESQCVLIFLSHGYFSSRNCRRELECAILSHKVLAIVHEEDRTHGGVCNRHPN
jgi:hypothetical protein